MNRQLPVWRVRGEWLGTITRLISRISFRRFRLKGGFTLVELLAVTLIIGILAALLFPAVSRAKLLARATACKSNLRQMGIAFASYTCDNKSAYPFTQAFYTNVSVPVDWTWVIHPYYQFTLKPFYTDSSSPSGNAFQCPVSSAYYLYNSFGYEVWYKGQFMGLGPIFPQYKVNAVDESAVKSPSRMFEVGEAPGRFSYSSLSMYKWDFYGTAQGKSYLQGRFHGEKYNVVYCDGHIQALNPRYIFVGKDSDPSWNLDNQLHR